MQKIVFIGAGSMAEAMLSGWITHDCLQPENIYVTNRSDYQRLAYLHETYGIRILENIADIADADCLILAIKPKDAQVALTNIAPYISDHTAILSVLAGVSIEFIEKILYARPIARVMPNTSATIGMSASGIAFNKHVNEHLKTKYISLLQAIGLVIEVAEDQLHAVTALSGSGPAYIYYLIEAFEKAGMQLGLPNEIVRDLMVQTIAGAATMLQSGDLDPSDLRKKVTSPGGTTEAGIDMLQQHHFIETITACVKSAEQRSRELAKEN